MPPLTRLPGRLTAPVFSRFLVFVLILTIFASPALALRVVSWNVLNASPSNLSSRIGYVRTVLSNLHPDLMIAEEIIGTDGAQNFLDNVLNYLEPGQWSMAPFVEGPDTENACYYRTTALNYQSMVTLSTALRDINGWAFKPDGYSASASEFRIYAVHLKASSGSDNEQKRLAEATILRNHLNSLPAGSHFLVGGDFNFYSASSEPAWDELTGSLSDNDGRVFDPINRVGDWHNNSAFVDVHSQSPRLDNLGDGGSTGGLDDRFDFLLANDDMLDGAGVAYLGGTYTTYGQDGNHFNKNITDSPTIPEGATIANALFRASDHLPLYLDLQMPAKLQITGTLGFGRVLSGSSPQILLSVSNPAPLPSDDLHYSVNASSGFTAPSGSSSVSAGGSGSVSIGVVTSTPADLSGTVDFTTNAPDDPTAQLAASATVLAPAMPSVRSDALVTSESADFGSHAEGEFSDIQVDAYNYGFDTLQALLNVYDLQISGTDASRFSVPGFSAVELGGSAANFTVHFDDSGVSGGLVYTAALHFKTRDEQGVFGASTRSDLVYELSATVQDVGTAAPAIPGVTRLLTNHPNPFNPRTTIRFDLARDTMVHLSIYDARGRRIASLLDGPQPAGSHSTIWNGVDSAGRQVASGVYFYRFQADGVDQTRSMTLVR